MNIENGVITTKSGKYVGTATKELKHGYHPAVKVVVHGVVVWFELDEPELLAKIADFAREQMHKPSKSETIYKGEKIMLGPELKRGQDLVMNGYSIRRGEEMVHIYDMDNKLVSSQDCVDQAIEWVEGKGKGEQS